MTTDDLIIDAIAKEGDASAGADYLELVRSQDGVLLVAEREGSVVGYGAIVDIDGVAMLCDLFVTASAHGRGSGRSCSSGCWTVVAADDVQLQARGCLARVRSRRHVAPVEEPVSGGCRHGRRPGSRSRALASRGAGASSTSSPRQGAVVAGDVVVMPEKAPDAGWWLMRLQGDAAVEAFARVRAALPAGSKLTLCAPEYSEVATSALADGFRVTDYDTFCATPDVELPAICTASIRGSPEPGARFRDMSLTVSSSPSPFVAGVEPITEPTRRSAAPWRRRGAAAAAGAGLPHRRPVAAARRPAARPAADRHAAGRAHRRAAGGGRARSRSTC